MRAVAIGTILAALIATPATAQDFSCRNESAEIRCAEGRCMVETSGFTPMSLTRRGGRLSICAYSGCWGAPIVMRRTRGSIDFLYAANLRAEAPGGGSGEDLAVTYDRASRTAQIKWAGFSNVMDCGASE